MTLRISSSMPPQRTNEKRYLCGAMDARTGLLTWLVQAPRRLARRQVLGVPAVHAALQPRAAALGAGLPDPGTVRGPARAFGSGYPPPKARAGTKSGKN
jgi:hypothetical protein